VIGVKKARRMPYFEVEKDLADRVNERFRQLKTLVVGKFEMTPLLAEQEYTGKESPFDVRLEGLGKEMLLDTQKEVPVEEYELTAQQTQVSPPKEKELMPKLNLRDQEMEEEGLPPKPEEGVEEPIVPPPTLRELPRERRFSPLLQIIAALLAIAAIIFGLNQFGVIHLWGKKAPVVESLPEPEITPPSQAPAEQPAGTGVEPKDGTTTPAEVEPTPLPTIPKAGEVSAKKATPAAEREPAVRQKPKPTPGAAAPAGLPPGEGKYTVQVSSWASRAKADAQVAEFSRGGYPAFVEEAVVAGQTWHRVRVGRYATIQEASQIAENLRATHGDGFWVGRIHAQ